MFSLGFFFFFFFFFKLYLNYFYFYFCRFRLVSPRSYIVTLIPMLNKFHKQTNNTVAIGMASSTMGAARMLLLISMLLLIVLLSILFLLLIAWLLR